MRYPAGRPLLLTTLLHCAGAAGRPATQPCPNFSLPSRFILFPAASFPSTLAEVFLEDRTRRRHRETKHPDDLLELQAARAAFERARILIVARGIVTKVSKQYEPRFGDGQLPVVCVSSKVYKVYVDGYDPDDTPCLEMQDTGFPELRQMLSRRALEENPITLHRRSMDPINRLHMLLQPGGGSWRRGSAPDIITVRLSSSQAELPRLTKQFRDQFEHCVMSLIDPEQGESLRTWPREVTQVLHKLEKKWPSSSTLTAFCMRTGYYKPRGYTAYTNWNESILNQLLPSMNTSLDSLKVQTRTIEASLIASGKAQLESCTADLRAHLRQQGEKDPIPRSYWETLRDHTTRFVEDSKDLFQHLHDRLSTAVNAAAFANDEASPFNRAMAAIYAEAETGLEPRRRGRTRRRWDFLHLRIASNADDCPLGALRRALAAAVQAEMADDTGLNTCLAQAFGHIRHDLEHVEVVIGIGEESRARALGALEAVLPEVRRMFAAVEGILEGLGEWEQLP